MSQKNAADRAELLFGGEPRADLLPPELKIAAKGRATRRIMVLLIVLALVMVAGGYTLASFTALQSQTLLDQANARTADLLAEQGKYAEVNQVNSALTLIQNAQSVGNSTKIEWKPLIEELESLLPAGTAVTVVTIDSATPTVPFEPPTVPMQGERIASIVIAASTPTLPDVKAMLESLKKLHGFVDAWPGPVTAGDAVYQLSLTIHVNQDVLSADATKEKK